jgi:energy-coupling factor transporter ATP-binding protein EcfA2
MAAKVKPVQPIESFTAGKDGGIDPRFAFVKDKKSIVQCKRLNNFQSLYSQLKKEKQKISNKNIDRYYISTTVGLTPQGKNKIYQLFYPLIKDESDIFGKDDIINLISKNQKIEEKYNKLWLTNTAVLKRLLNAKVYNYSTIKLQQIKDDVRIYVHNESYANAQAILDECHYIIISGIPGIGKTTLARMLVYNLIASGIDDLIYISTNIGEALKSYRKNTKQVFLFDDFLGKNFLEDRLDRNEDQELISFIKKIKESKNKYFIMTTREYITSVQNRNRFYHTNSC